MLMLPGFVEQGNLRKMFNSVAGMKQFLKSQNSAASFY